MGCHSAVITAFIVIAALLLDAALGEPRRYHPLVGFGRLAQAVEQRLYGDSFIRGAVAITILLLPLVVITMMISIHWFVEIILLYLTLGWKSLGEHANRVVTALDANDLPTARQRVGDMVSRDTSTLNERDVAKATVESVLENGNDAIFGALFWFVVAGVPGVILFRLSNTLDAMWGYRTQRYLRFGWAAARLDDLLNYIPARLTALSYALVGNYSRAMRCWRHQGSGWKSPNAGPVMAAGAGSIDVQLGGTAIYQGVQQQRPPLGEGDAPTTEHIGAALQLIKRALLLWVTVLLLGGWFVS